MLKLSMNVSAGIVITNESYVRSRFTPAPFTCAYSFQYPKHRYTAQGRNTARGVPAFSDGLFGKRNPRNLSLKLPSAAGIISHSTNALPKARQASSAASSGVSVQITRSQTRFTALRCRLRIARTISFPWLILRLAPSNRHALEWGRDTACSFPAPVPYDLFSSSRSVIFRRLMPSVDPLCSNAEVVGGSTPATPSAISVRLKPTMKR